MKEILIYLIVGVCSLVVMTYVVDMFVGGMVSPETETRIQEAVAGVLVLLFALAAWDVVRRRRRKK
jgi:putative Ca2+/H+ antiporter (TMEM165/GDT1 family)